MERKIPVSEIDKGIFLCIDNSKQILSAGKILFEKGFWQQAVVLYYYSLEEFGKALILKDRKQNAEKNNLSEIEASDVFRLHDTKIEAARKEMGSKSDIVQFKEISADRKFHNLEEDGPAVNDFQDRSSLFLIDYDPKAKTWGKYLTLPIHEQIENAIKNLEEKLSFY